VLVHLHNGPATRTLLDAAEGADLLVVGHRGRGGWVGLRLGSSAEQVVSHAPCTVVVVRPPRSQR
jgi:nucleotide-binding universal stress UspA family protein